MATHSQKRICSPRKKYLIWIIGKKIFVKYEQTNFEFEDHPLKFVIYTYPALIKLTYYVKVVFPPKLWWLSLK